MVKGFAIEGTQAIYMFSSALILVIDQNQTKKYQEILNLLSWILTTNFYNIRPILLLSYKKLCFEIEIVSVLLDIRFGNTTVLRLLSSLWHNTILFCGQPWKIIKHAILGVITTHPKQNICSYEYMCLQLHFRTWINYIDSSNKTFPKTAFAPKHCYALKRLAFARLINVKCYLFFYLTQNERNISNTKSTTSTFFFSSNKAEYLPT